MVTVFAALARVDDATDPLRSGLAAGALAAILMLVSHMSMLVVAIYVLGPLVRRPMGEMAPSRAAAVVLWFLYYNLEEASRRGRRSRRVMLRSSVARAGG